MKQPEKSQQLIPWGEKIDLTKREVYRVYVFPGGETIRIDNPLFLIVSTNGHRVGSPDGISHYIPYGWIHLWWKSRPERKDHFYCENPDKPK